MVCFDREHIGVYRVFYGLDDVWRDRYPDQKNAQPQCDLVWAADGDPRIEWLIDSSAFGHLD